MINKEVDISLNGFSVKANKISRSHCDNSSLTLLNNGDYIGSINLNKFKFKFLWKNDYTNYYILIEK